MSDQNRMNILREECTKNVKAFNVRMDKFEEKLNDFKLEVVREIAALPDKLEGKFAPKWVADVMKIVGTSVVLTLVAAVLALVFK